ncbi:dockerin type I domain-containing protein [Lactococcus lactis]
MNKYKFTKKTISMIMASHMLISPLVLDPTIAFAAGHDRTEISMKTELETSSITFGELSAIVRVESDEASSTSPNNLSVTYSPPEGETEYNDAYVQELKITIENGTFTGTVPEGLEGSVSFSADKTSFKLLSNSKPIDFALEYEAKATNKNIVFTFEYSGTYTTTEGNEMEMLPKQGDEPLTLEVPVIDSELEAAKESGVETISNLKNLSEEEKSNFINDITSASTVDAIDDIVDEAQALDDTNLQNAKDSANEQISDMEYLNETEKSGFIDSVSSTTTISEINDILEAAKNQNTENQNNEELEIAKGGATDSVNNLNNLSESDKNDYINQINNASSVEDIDELVNNAMNKDNQVLSDTKSLAEDEIEALLNLTDEQKKDFISQVDSVTKASDIDNILTLAHDTDSANLHNSKTNAINQIHNLENISLKEKDAYIDEINESHRITDIDLIIAHAVAADADDLEAFRQTAIDTLNSFTHISDEDKAAFLDSITSATSIDVIRMELANALNQEKLATVQEARANAKDKVSNLEYLTDDEKNNFNSQLDTALTVNDITDILDAATEQNKENQTAAELEKYRTTAIETVNNLQNLLEEDQDMFIDWINNAQSIVGITDALAQARAVDADRLTDAKNIALGVIGGFDNLSDERKNHYTDLVNNSSSSDEITDILNEATEENTEAAVTLGDLNSDGYINILDISLLKLYLLNGEIPEEVNQDKFKRSADFNEDGLINILDLSALTQYVQNS